MTKARVVIVEADSGRATALLEMLATTRMHAPTLFREGAEAMRCVPLLKPHVGIVGVELPGALDGLETATQLGPHCQGGLVMLGDNLQTDQLERVRTVRAHYLVWPIHLDQLTATVHIACGERHHAQPPSRSGTFAVDLSDATNASTDLSAREREVYGRLVQGERVADIAKALFISPHTARKHTKAVFRKLQVHSHIELMQRHQVRSRSGR